MSEKVQNEDGAQGVAETQPYFAAESPGGPKGPGPCSPYLLAAFNSPGAVGPGGACPCGEPHDARETLGTAPLAGSGGYGFGCFPKCGRDVSGHEVYCGCPDCHDDDSCSGCGRTCDEDFCFCPPNCAICGEEDEIDLSMEQFTFTIEPGTLSHGDYQDCCSPDTLMAFWDDDELIVGDTQSDARWRFIYFEPQNSPASRQYYTWYCKRIGVLNPCDENFMKAISS